MDFCCSMILSSVLFAASARCHAIPREKESLISRSSSSSSSTPDDSPRVSTATIVIAVVVPIAAILLFAGIIYYTYRRSGEARTPMTPNTRSLYVKTFSGNDGGYYRGAGRSWRSSTMSHTYDASAPRALMGADMGKIWPIPRPFSQVTKKSGNSGRFSVGSYTWYPDTPKSKATSRGHGPYSPGVHPALSKPKPAKIKSDSRHAPESHGPIIYTDNTPLMTQTTQPSRLMISPEDFRAKSPSVTHQEVEESSTTSPPTSSNAATAVAQTPPTQSAEAANTGSSQFTNGVRFSNMDIAHPYIPPTGLYEQLVSNPTTNNSTPNLHNEGFVANSGPFTTRPRPSLSYPALNTQNSASAPPTRHIPGRSSHPSSSVYSVYIPARHPSRIAQSGLSISTATASRPRPPRSSSNDRP